MGQLLKKYLAGCYRDKRPPHPQDLALLEQIETNAAALNEGAILADRREMLAWQVEGDLEKLGERA